MAGAAGFARSRPAAVGAASQPVKSGVPVDAAQAAAPCLDLPPMADGPGVIVAEQPLAERTNPGGQALPVAPGAGGLRTGDHITM